MCNPFPLLQASEDGVVRVDTASSWAVNHMLNKQIKHDVVYIMYDKGPPHPLAGCNLGGRRLGGGRVGGRQTRRPHLRVRPRPRLDVQLLK